MRPASGPDGRLLGENRWGQLGTGTFMDSRHPVAVPGLDDVVTVNAGLVGACALIADGSVQCWGIDESGELGRGSITPEGEPGHPDAAPVVDLVDAVAIGGSGDFRCAIDRAGALWCWGRNHVGQTGDPSGADTARPVRYPGLPAVTAFSGHDLNGCALVADGTARCWGINDYGQLGNGEVGSRAITRSP